MTVGFGVKLAVCTRGALRQHGGRREERREETREPLKGRRVLLWEHPVGVDKRGVGFGLYLPSEPPVGESSVSSERREPKHPNREQTEPRLFF